MNRHLNTGMLLIAVMAAASTVRADEMTDAVVSANGVAKIERAPDRMRMQIEVLSKGSDAKQAVEGLKKRIESVRAQLAAFGVVADSITVQPPRTFKMQGDQQQQIQMMMLQRMRQGNRKAAAATEQTKPPVTISASLSAEWKLDGESADDRFVFAQALQDRIKAADLSGSKAAEELTPEQQELLEEMESEEQSYYSSDQQKPGEPAFMFVASISPEQHQQALSEAFAKAKDQAARLARAAGEELGGVKSIQENSVAAYESDYDPWETQSSVMYRMLQSAQNQAAGSGTPTEAVGTDTANVSLKVALNATFYLRRP